MSSLIWTPAALRSEAAALAGDCWRLVEAQHRISTMKLVDTLEEEALLEAELERTKPPGPPDCAHLDYLLATPFRYGRYPGSSRFRREGMTPGVFYASEAVETAVAETAFYRLLFFRDSPATPYPANPLEFTAFRTPYATLTAIDLTAAPFDRDAARWADPYDYSHCLALADAAREAEIAVIRYRSVRDSAGGANLAILSCRAFTADRPQAFMTWRLAISARGVNAICDWPNTRLALPVSLFAGDPRFGNQPRP